MPEITLRDHFAGLALAGILSCHRVAGTDQEQAKAAYTLADAMLEARGQQDAQKKEEKTCEWTWQTHKNRNEIRTSCGHLYPGLILGFECPHCHGRIVVRGRTLNV